MREIVTTTAMLLLILVVLISAPGRYWAECQYCQRRKR
jgi:hypothetical protein